MKSKIKNYKSTKVRNTFYKKKISFFFHAGNLKSRDYIKIEQKLIQNKFKIHTAKNNLVKTENIINAAPIIYSTISTGCTDNFKSSFTLYLTRLFKFHHDLIFVSLIYDNKLYLPREFMCSTENSAYLDLILFFTGLHSKCMLVLTCDR
jgi:hypothetical protein